MSKREYGHGEYRDGLVRGLNPISIEALVRSPTLVRYVMNN